MADDWARREGYDCLYGKFEKDSSSRSRVDINTDPTARIVNIEGLEQVLEKSTEGCVYGVAVDCNCSGGSSLRDAIKEFNDTITAIRANILPIDRVYVLYRPDTDPLTDGLAPGTTFDVTRFFDLDEEMKGMLWQVKQSCTGRRARKGINQYNGLLGTLQEKNLIKYDK